MTQSYMGMGQSQLQYAWQQQQQYPPQVQQFAAQPFGYGGAYTTGTPTSNWHAAGQQPPGGELRQRLDSPQRRQVLTTVSESTGVVSSSRNQRLQRRCDS